MCMIVAYSSILQVSYSPVTVSSRSVSLVQHCSSGITHSRGKPSMRPSQKTMLPIVLFRLTMGTLPRAMSGS